VSASFTDLVAMAQLGDEDFRPFSRAHCLECTRVYFRARWSEVRERHDHGESGANVVRQLAELADTIVRGAVVFSLHFTNAGRGALTRVAVCALGGYGRNELSPSSDLDVGILTEGRVNNDIKRFCQFLMTFLWDIGFHVGSTFHTVSEALALAKKDPEVFTTYAQARIVAGDNAVFARLSLRLSELQLRHGARALAHVRRRLDPGHLAPALDDLYGPEPNVKESAGGLRDFHTGLWMTYLSRGMRGLDELAGLGLMPAEEHLDLLEGLDFMLRVRNELHFHTGRDENVLTYDLQHHLAKKFDYGGDPVHAIDRFMKDYYGAARRMRGFLQIAARIAENASEISEPAPAIDPGDIVVREGLLHAGLHDRNWFVENPPRLMRIFYESARHGVPLSKPAERLVTWSLPQVGDSLQSSDLARRFFVAILGKPLRAGAVLRQMSECGLLGAYLPEFRAVQDVVRYEDFHHYPVDEHTLRAVEALADIPRMEGPVARLLERVLQHTAEPYVLALAILLHDLGKAEGETHVETGVRITHAVCHRIGLPAEVTERVAFLVEHHLDMNHIAMYRDSDDPDIIRNFASLVTSADRLGMLLLLSYADLCAVAPGVWTDWKGALLLKLFLKAERLLLGRAHVLDEAYWTQPKAAAVHEHAPDRTAESVEAYLRGLGERYFIAFSAQQMAQHMQTLDEARETGFAVYFETHEDTNTTEVVVCTPDRPGLFAQLTGSFTSQLCDVRAAALFTCADGLVLDCFTVLDASRNQPLTESQHRQLAKVFKAVLTEGDDVQRLVDLARKRLFALLQPRAPVRTRIGFDNACSRSYTVIDVETGDRTGLLYDITRALTGAGLDIQSARIVTDARRARDAFYVQMNGNKLEDPDGQATVREALTAAAEAWLAPEAKGGH
jgi:[protein-PII] uridylyltransferase